MEKKHIFLVIIMLIICIAIYLVIRLPDRVIQLKQFVAEATTQAGTQPVDLAQSGQIVVDTAGKKQDYNRHFFWPNWYNIINLKNIHYAIIIN